MGGEHGYVSRVQGLGFASGLVFFGFRVGLGSRFSELLENLHNPLPGVGFRV